ncbi:MAG TPA: amino acid adenylation domain-containing protein, partial [Longimicrobiaceae bacterium]|nr:amino acid adenylation domain-containing protein [Longimicrobiaceae bacterium]
MELDPLTDVLELSPEQLQLLALLLEDEGIGASAPDPIPRRRGSRPLPLSFAQQRLWFLQRLEPESAAYNVPVALRLRGALEVATLERTLTEIVRRHEALRTVFAEAGGEPVQVVLAPEPATIPVAELAGLPEGAREAEVRRLARAEAARPFDLERGPLLRVRLLQLGAAESVLLLTLHHIVSDEWSTGVLVREVSALYRAFARGESSPLPELPVQYADYALWQREQLSGETLERQLAYWRERLAGAPPLLELPTDRPRPETPGGEAASRPFALPPRTTAALRALAHAGGTTLFATLLAGWQALLGRWAGEEEVCVGTPVANRGRAELEGVIGFFVNTLVMRLDLSGDPTVRELLERTRAAVVEGQENPDLPFERLVEELGAGRTLRHTPLFQVLFTLQNAARPETLRLDGVELEPLPTESGRAKFDLVMELTDDGERITGRAEYRTELFDGATVDRMLGHYAALLAGMAADPGRRVSGIPVMGAEERGRVTREWNATGAAYPVGACLHHLVEAQAERTPGAVAVSGEGGELTYAELEGRANRLAHHLRTLGVGVDARVGLCVERGPEAMVGVLGILKAGAACVPLDPGYPAERLASMLENAGAAVVVTQERPASRLPDTGAVRVRLDADAPEIARRSGARPEGGADPESLAYVIYTSGSTGTPKGVAMPHRPLVNLIAWQLAQGPRAAATLHFAPLSFDVSFQEIFSAWAGGGRLVLIDEERRRDPAAMLERVEGEGVERLFLPFVALQQVAERADACGVAPRALREVVTAGEQLRVTGPIRRWLGALGVPLHNHYGPSETHVVTAHALRGDASAWPLLPPIGRPIANTRCYVLDRHLDPSPVGVPGELFLGGVGVARGYLGRPDLTAESFLPDPFSPVPGARVYRSGDRARWTAGGELEFLGRMDDQGKVRGFRVEPGEVEAALERHPGVREAVVVVREDAPGERRLVGYLVPAGGELRAGEVRAWLRERLPEYLVPAALVVLERLPLTPSGKIARRALPAPSGAGDDADGHAAPRTPTEEILAGIWAEVLRAGRVGIHD